MNELAKLIRLRQDRDKAEKQFHSLSQEFMKALRGTKTGEEDFMITGTDSRVVRFSLYVYNSYTGISIFAGANIDSLRMVDTFPDWVSVEMISDAIVKTVQSTHTKLNSDLARYVLFSNVLKGLLK